MADLRTFTIYDHPLDFPEHWVVREWDIGDGVTTPASVYKCNSLDRAREYVLAINPGMVRLDRHPMNDPKIVETWL